jgi:outer membrane receptor protein involved in Fe transport
MTAGEIKGETMNRFELLMAVTIVEFSWQSPVLAQSEPQLSNGEPPGALTEIVVTAQKRSENLQVVPIAITALSGAELASAGVGSTTDLALVTPGLTVVNIAGIVLPHIRGIGTTAYGAGLENSVSTYIDGVYIASGSASLLSLNNVAQIEVLKGPQGTLFGRNATGGLMQIITKDPQSNFNGEATLGYGNFQTVQGNFYVTGPVVPTLDADLAVHASTQGEGYGTNLFNGKDVYRPDRDIALRSKWRWTPGEETDMTISVDYEELGGTQSTTFQNAPGTLPIFGKPRPTTAWDIDSDFQPSDSFKGGGAGIRLVQYVGIGKIASITAYRRSQDFTAFDADGLPVPIQTIPVVRIDDQQFTQELQLSSQDTGRVEWVAGAFFLHGDSKYDPSEVILGGPLISPVFPLDKIYIYGDQTTDAWAVYGQGTLTITDADRLTVGLRYSDERKRLTATEPGELVGGIPIQLISPPIDTSKTFTRPTWRVAFDHRFSSSVMGYLSYNRGFKSGGFNPGVPTDPAYAPEVLTAYETGLKVDLLDHRLRLNSAAYYYDYKNIQVAHYVLGQIGYYNGAAAEVYGLDSDLEAVVAPGLTLAAGISLIHDRFTNFPNAVIDTQIPTGGVDITTGSANGNRLPLTPNGTFNLSADYRHLLADGEAGINVSYGHSSGYFFQPDNRMEQPAFNLVNAMVSWSRQGERLKISLWGKNLTNEVIANALLPSAIGSLAAYRPPRTFGVLVGTKF